eukprot:4086601-Alexandrium_andersonii.AAC.1
MKAESQLSRERPSNSVLGRGLEEGGGLEEAEAEQEEVREGARPVHVAPLITCRGEWLQLPRALLRRQGEEARMQVRVRAIRDYDLRPGGAGSCGGGRG